MKHFSIISVLVCASLLCIACNGNTPEHGSATDAMKKSPKRGVAFKFTNLEDLPLLTPAICWSYNWGNTASDNASLWFDTHEMDYCPMCWNGSYNADNIRAYVAAHPNTKYLLAFNEPNLTDQARMTPKEAAAIWAPVVALTKELKLKLVSPAMNYGTLSGYGDPIKWLDEFFAQPEVNSNDIYAISIHCYMASASGLKGFVEMFEKYNKPIWLTEFCAWDPVPGSEETQVSYMCSALNYLEQHASVERYAWFIPRYTRAKEPYMQLIIGYDPPTLTMAGKVYTLFSSFDKSCYLRTRRFIHAGEYCALSNEATQVRPNTDAQAIAMAGKDGLMVNNFSEGQSLTYQVAVTSDSHGKLLTMRYCGYSNSICEVQLDGKTLTHIDLPRTGSATEWQTAHGSVTAIAKGNHTITFRLLSGSCNFSGFEIQGTDD